MYFFPEIEKERSHKITKMMLGPFSYAVAQIVKEITFSNKRSKGKRNAKVKGEESEVSVKMKKDRKALKIKLRFVEPPCW